MIATLRANQVHTPIALAMLLLAPLALARAQAPAGQPRDLRVNPTAQTGRLLDANPQVGGGRFNYTRPVSPLIGGNLYASGNVGAGLSLRSTSPIADPTAFRAPLGTGSLSAFERDSVGVLSGALGSQPYAQPYFNTATVAPTGGYLQGFVGLTRTEPAPVSPLDRRVALRINPQAGPLGQGDSELKLGTPATPIAPPGPPSQYAAYSTASSIFGVPPPRLPLPLESDPPWARWSETGREERATSDSRGVRLPGVEQALATPLNDVLRRDLYPGTELTRSGPRDVGLRTGTGLVLPERPEPAADAAPGIPPRVTDPRVLPGYDVYTDLRLAAALVEHPDAQWFAELQQAARENPEIKRQGTEVAEDAERFLDGMLNTPLRSLSGGGASGVNDQLLKAEALMQIGHYGEAVDRYEAAALLEPDNPLPLIGKAHALLAQGQYRSAAAALLQGIALADRTPGLAALLFKRLDLQALMGSGEVVDIRRADLMKHLEQNDLPELRFLLGYLEYHTGNRALGLENIKRAAGHPRAGAIIGRYPAILGEPVKFPSRSKNAESALPAAVPAPPLSSSGRAADEPLVVPPR